MINEDYILPDKIKDILSRYYDGLTTLEEEKLLKKYFNEHQIPESLHSDLALLSFTKSNETPFFTSSEIWGKIKKHEAEQNRYKRVIRFASSIAASVIISLSIGAWYFFSTEKHTILTIDTYSNPEDAYRVAQKYLGFVSGKLSYAYNEIKPMEKLAIPCEAIGSFSEIEKNLKPLNQLNRINVAAKEFEHFSAISDIVKLDKN